MTDFIHDSGEEFPEGRRWQVLSLPVVLAIGWIIYEVSHSPGLAAMVMCLKFGWEDFRTAVWLRRRDPWRARGRANFSLYLASGMWKAALIGIVMVFVTLVAETIVNIGNANNAGGNAPPPLQNVKTLILGAFGATLFGQAIACLACSRALSIARTHRIPLWLSGSVHFARHQNDWPPLYGFANRLVWLNASCFLFGWLIFMPILSMITGDYVNDKLKIPVPRGLFYFIFFFGFMRRAMRLSSQHRALGIFATHPAQSWGTEPVEAVHEYNPTRANPAAPRLRGRPRNPCGATNTIGRPMDSSVTSRPRRARNTE